MPSAPREELAPIDIAALNLESIWIEAGTFTMGLPASEVGRKDDEGPQHKVTLEKEFWIGKFELAQAQWEDPMWACAWCALS
ncbi:MAG: formylglycine-generating enzyme family protein [Candidatus Latescibacterota bacterium]